MRYTEKDRDIFSKRAEELAPLLLGKVLCRRLENGKEIKLKIVDVEAYASDDTANYGYGYEGNGGNKRKTKANAPLFQQGGTCCVYAGMLLIVCGEKGKPDNILIRGCADHENKYDGPIKVAKALGIDSGSNLKGEDLLISERLWIENEDIIGSICQTTRHGLGSTTRNSDKHRRYRFLTI